MVGPVTFLTATFASTTMGEVLHRAVDNMLKTPNLIEACVTRMENKMDIAREGHFKAAYMALRNRGDTHRAMEKLEEGLAVDPANAQGWIVYATLLAQQDNALAKKSAVDIFLQTAEWFGVNSPILPPEIKNVFGVQPSIQVPSAVPISKRVQAVEADWLHCKDVTVSEAGIAVAYFKKHSMTWWHDKVAVRAYFRPWIDGGPYGSGERVMISEEQCPLNGRFPFAVVTHMTPKFLVTRGSTVHDLTSLNTKYLGEIGVREIFGERKDCGYINSDGSVKGVTVKFDMETWKQTMGSGFSGQATITYNKPFVTAVPPVIDPKAIMRAGR